MVRLKLLRDGRAAENRMRKTKDAMTTACLLALHKGADQTCGPDRDTFVALWERASAVGDNPEALFTWMVNQPESWAWICAEDRRKAQVRLNEFDGSRPKVKAVNHASKLARRVAHRRFEKYSYAPPGDVYLSPEAASAFSDSSVVDYKRRLRRCRQQKLVWIVSGFVVLLVFARLLI